MPYMALLRFLAHREMQEMLRKLLLSVVGALWTQKPVTCVATALVLSATFQVLHTAYWPFNPFASLVVYIYDQGTYIRHIAVANRHVLVALAPCDSP
jgi:hypothetical protein